jgi:hypothetical protein
VEAELAAAAAAAGAGAEAEWRSLREFVRAAPGEDPCSGAVARIVAARGVQALGRAMAAHLGRPRLLEDALCALSNFAFAAHGVRLLIGRGASALVVALLRVLNGDAYLFQMALRAVGNLTRADENILSAVASGVIGGIVEGMRKNRGDADALRLAADVIGNLASIEPLAVEREAGARALRKGLRRRERDAAKRAAAAAAASAGAATTTCVSATAATVAAAAAASDPVAARRPWRLLWACRASGGQARPAAPRVFVWKRQGGSRADGHSR